MKTAGVEASSHQALRVPRGRGFVRNGDLPDDTAAFVEDLYKDRLRADYELASFSPDAASRKVAKVGERIDQFAELL
mgnify:CR=1 FL=1